MLKKIFFFCLVTLALDGALSNAQQTEPPAGAATAQMGFPSVGTKWVARSGIEGRPAQTTTFTVAGEDTYEGKAVWKVIGGPDTLLFDKETANLIASLQGGKEVFAYLPNSGLFSWPLWVGKSWTTTFTYYDRVRERKVENASEEYTVQAYEEITVPAGTWKAFKIHTQVGRTSTTVWYAPDIKLIVKRTNETALDQPPGHATFVYEILEYPAK